MAFPQMPIAKIPKSKDGSGIDVIVRNSIGVLTIKLPLASKIWSNELTPLLKKVTLETTLPPVLVGQPFGALVPT